jgi:CrcB protein
MFKLLAIMAGGSIGAACRHGMFVVVQRWSGSAFPAGTLAVNLLGSFMIGFLWYIFDKPHWSQEMRLFLFTGLLGGFTTFSTFTRETFQFFKLGDWKSAVTYVTLSNVLGITLVFVGYLLCKRLMVMMAS